MPTLDDDDAVEGDAHSAPADAPGAVPVDDAAPAEKSLGEDVIDSASVSEAPVQQFKRNTSRLQAARKAFAEKIAASKVQTAEATAPAKEAAADPEDDDDAPPAEPPAAAAEKQAAADVAAAVVKAAAATAPPAPSLDPEVARMRQQLAADREEWEKARDTERAAFESERADYAKAHRAPEASLEDYIDNSVKWYRDTLEAMRGEKMTDEEFKLEMHDFITQGSADVLGVPLPKDVRSSLDAAQAKKIVRTHKTIQARREAAAAKQAELDRTKAATTAEVERIEQEWTKATDVISRLFVGEAADKPAAAATSYPWLAAEDAPGKIVVDVIRAASKKDGTQLSWQEAAKKANDYLASQWQANYDKRKPLLGASAPAKPAAAKSAAQAPVAKPAPAAVPATVDAAPKKWSRDQHMERTRAAFRTALKTTPPAGE